MKPSCKVSVGNQVVGGCELEMEAVAGEGNKVPTVGSGIQIEAREGVFVVLRADVDRETVDVLRMSGVRQIEGGVPLGSVRILRGLNAIDQLRNRAD